LITIFFILNRDHVKAESYLQRAVLSPRISEDIIHNLQTMFNEKFE
jgi:Flp pilus assembly protein TadD